MKSTELQKEISQLMELFNGSFINSHNELILVPKTNLYFRLEDIETVLDLKCKVIAWCSRHACKTPYCRVEWRNKAYQASVREKINRFLGVRFDLDEWALIYTYLGNDIRHELCEKFIESNYDIFIIKKEYEQQ